ncbi:MAG: hypothetical protein KDD55_05790 [Bdellovibrionales bacterium]|nr:hypothetical protein [Bdellovibrionales bacterium]
MEVKSAWFLFLTFSPLGSLRWDWKDLEDLAYERASRLRDDRLVAQENATRLNL